MKILFFNSFSAIQGGAERLLLDTVMNLLREGHQTSLLIANDDRHVKSKEFWPGKTNRYYLSELLVPLSNRNIYYNYLRSRKYISAVRYLQDIIDIENPDIIHVHNFPFLEVFKDLKIKVPLIRTIHSYENLCRSRMKILPDRSICYYPMGEKCKEICEFDDSFFATRIRSENRFMKKRFSRIVAISSWIKSVLLLNSFPEKKIITIPNFTNCSPQGLTLEENDQILFVGRITPEKGLEELIGAISKTKTNPTLKIVGANGLLGQNAYEKFLLSEAQNLGVTVVMEPWIEKEALTQAYQSAKIVALSSNWPEPFGLVGIEAMIHGKAVISFDVGGVRDWLKDGVNGFIVPHLNTDIFADRIDQLLFDDQLRKQMGNAGRQLALQNFSPDRHVEHLIHLYKETIHENSAY